MFVEGWHIGSCTKSMTATLAAILISKELLPSFQLSVQTALKLRLCWEIGFCLSHETVWGWNKNYGENV